MLMFILTGDKKKVIDNQGLVIIIIIRQMQDITHWVNAQFMTERLAP